MIAPATSRRSSSACCIAVCALLAVIYPASNSQAQNIPQRIVTWESYSPPLKKAGTGGFSIPMLSAIVQGKSPSVRLFQRGMEIQPQFSDSLRSLDIGKTQSTCVELLSDTGAPRNLPIDLGSILRLSFRHSIYGSLVEELFALRRDGFLLTQLRYGEARLVDFYGYENAELENGAWVVNPPPVLLPSISLNTSAGGAMAIYFDRYYDAKPLMIRPTGALHLTVASCKSSSHG